MGYATCKDYMRKVMCVLVGENYRKVLGDNDKVTYVVACTFHNITSNLDVMMTSQMCHNSVGHYASGEYSNGIKLPIMLDHIQGGSREHIEQHVQTKEESIRFLQWWMDHPIFSQSFLEHDAKIALEERIMVRDMAKLPANAAMFATIGTRALWEQYQSAIPRRFCAFVDMGINADLAYILAYYLKINDKGDVIHSAIPDSGHVTLATDKFTFDGAVNFINNKMIFPAPGPFTEGYCQYIFDPCDGKTHYLWNVFSLFENKFSSAYRDRLTTDPATFKQKLVEYVGDNHLDKEKLLAFQEYIYGLS